MINFSAIIFAIPIIALWLWFFSSCFRYKALKEIRVPGRFGVSPTAYGNSAKWILICSFPFIILITSGFLWTLLGGSRHIQLIINLSMAAWVFVCLIVGAIISFFRS